MRIEYFCFRDHITLIDPASHIFSGHWENFLGHQHGWFVYPTIHLHLLMSPVNSGHMERATLPYGSNNYYIRGNINWHHYGVR